MQDPNSNENKDKDALNANPETLTHGTEKEKTSNPGTEGEQGIDYKEKFSQSTREAQRLLDEKKRLEAERDEAIRARMEAEARFTTPEKDLNFDEVDSTTDEIVPGFNDLEPEQKESILRLSQGIAKRATSEVYKDPAIAFVKQTYNEKRFDDAFEALTQDFPQLKEAKAEFKSKYFDPKNVPNNIDKILPDVAKIFLFDKAKEIGAEEERQRQGRIDTERATAGDKSQPTSRTLEEWQQLQQRDPAKFARLSAQYNEDLKSGRLDS